MKRKFCVLIDNGHGDDTPDKCSPEHFRTRIYEWKYTRELAKALSNRLNSQGVMSVLVTPEDKDISLAERVRRVNYYSGIYDCILISIHLNASPSDNLGTGFEVFSTTNKTNSDILAQCFMDTFNKCLPGKRNRGHKEYNWTILFRSNCPCVLTENMFMNNVKDVEFLNSRNGFNAIVEHHLQSILRYIDINKKQI